jgi:hypothetical protein
VATVLAVVARQRRTTLRRGQAQAINPAMPPCRQFDEIRLRIFFVTAVVLILQLLTGLTAVQVMSMPSREPPIDAPAIDKYQASVAGRAGWAIRMAARAQP